MHAVCALARKQLRNARLVAAAQSQSTFEPDSRTGIHYGSVLQPLSAVLPTQLQWEPSSLLLLSALSPAVLLYYTKIHSEGLTC